MVAVSPTTPTKTEFRIADLAGSASKVIPYTKDFTKDLEADTVENFTTRLLPRKIDPNSEVDPQAFTPLSMLMENSILIPLRAQIQVVQSSLMNYMLVDAGLMEHLKALRNYLLFHDGEFAHHLSTSLFNEINEASVATEILNPATLNR